jgi:predicted ribosomally synthesized peptide with SipW-like signal peptide
MTRIIKSLFLIVAVVAIAAGSTSAYFSSKASITGNTFSTGTLQIRVNGVPEIVGATFSPMIPGQVGDSPQYEINNFGPPWFAGPSNLTAKQLILNVTNPNDSGSGLYDKLKVKVEVNRGWPVWQVAYDGNINALSNVDLLNPNWTELTPGNSESFRYHVYLPEDGTDQSALMGKTLTWDFAIEGRTN